MTEVMAGFANLQGWQSRRPDRGLRAEGHYRKDRRQGSRIGEDPATGVYPGGEA